MGMLLVGSPQYLPLVWPRGRQKPLIVHARYDVGKLSVAILLLDFWIKRLEAGRQNDRPNLYLLLLRCLIQIYCVILAHSLANATLLLFEVQAAFVDIRNKWNCLSEVYMDCLILRYLLIILIRVLDRTIFHTGRTTGAFVLKNIPWPLGQGYLEASYLAFDTVNFSVGEDLYIWVPADLDQLG